jgi:hypothetical protein
LITSRGFGASTLLRAEHRRRSGRQTDGIRGLVSAVVTHLAAADLARSQRQRHAVARGGRAGNQLDALRRGWQQPERRDVADGVLGLGGEQRPCEPSEVDAEPLLE